MTTDDTGFLAPPPESAAADRLFAHDREAFGFVMNLSRAWAHHPEVHDDLFALLGRTAEAAASRTASAASSSGARLDHA